MDKEILLAQPRGFCAGVDRAIEIVERALIQFGAPIYVRHEIVHNAYVVADLREKGAVFIEELADVPRGNTVIFSAHGVSKAVQAEAELRGLKVFDATCPLVTKVHIEVAKMRREGREIIMIGHDGHPEVEGTMGQTDQGMHLVETVSDVENLNVTDPEMLSYVSQTTLSVDDTADVIAALKRKYPHITEPKKATSVTQPLIASKPLSLWRRKSMLSLWWEVLTVRTLIVCGKWPKKWVRWLIWSITRPRSIRHGCRIDRGSA